MKMGRTLAASAVIGILTGCGGEPPPAAVSPSTDTTAAGGAKAACGGAEHTDKGHCGGLGVSGAAPTPSASSSAAPPATK